MWTYYPSIEYISVADDCFKQTRERGEPASPRLCSIIVAGRQQAMYPLRQEVL